MPARAISSSSSMVAVRIASVTQPSSFAAITGPRADSVLPVGGRGGDEHSRPVCARRAIGHDGGRLADRRSRSKDAPDNVEKYRRQEEAEQRHAEGTPEHGRADRSAHLGAGAAGEVGRYHMD